MLSEDEVAVFLVPLWEETVLVVERRKVARGTVRQMARALLEATGKLRQETRAGRGSETPTVSAEKRQAAHAQLARLLEEMGMLLAPWAHHLQVWQPTELILSPHFLLNLLPLHATMWQGKPLIEHYPVVYLPAPALAQEVLKQRKPLSGQALLLGNPTQDLPGAAAEVHWVATRLASRGIPSHTFIGEQATTDCVDAHAPSAGLVHCACHSVLEVADFLQSGLELADRRLTGLEIMARLKLTNAALVYLSSCDSGHSRVGRTDELLALVRAFLYAGSPTVLATLWALDDGTGYSFATHFYKRWIGEEQPLAVAFQQAMVATRRLYAQQPFFWAPFVLVGAWR